VGVQDHRDPGAERGVRRSLVVAAHAHRSHSSHDIPLDRPDVVEAQIEKMLKAWSRKEPEDATMDASSGPGSCYALVALTAAVL